MPYIVFDKIIMKEYEYNIKFYILHTTTNNHVRSEKKLEKILLN